MSDSNSKQRTYCEAIVIDLEEWIRGNYNKFGRAVVVKSLNEKKKERK